MFSRTGGLSPRGDDSRTYDWESFDGGFITFFVQCYQIKCFHRGRFVFLFSLFLIRNCLFVPLNIILPFFSFFLFASDAKEFYKCVNLLSNRYPVFLFTVSLLLQFSEDCFRTFIIY